MDQEDFNEGINWILNKISNENNELFNNCLKVVDEKFNSDLIVNKYLEIYKSFLNPAK